MLGYILSLERQRKATAADRASAAVAKPKEDYVPLDVQVQQLLAALPPNQRNRDQSLADLCGRLRGKYGVHPHPAKLSAILRGLGWTSWRDCSRSGGNARLWRPPAEPT
jgi:hypothetical protein